MKARHRRVGLVFMGMVGLSLASILMLQAANSTIAPLFSYVKACNSNNIRETVYL